MPARPHALLIVLAVLCGGCQFVPGKAVSPPISAMVGGSATGSGATMTTPNAAPTGQGLTDKAALQAYRSPNGTGPAVWTVTTN